MVISGTVSPIVSGFIGGDCAPQSMGNSIATSPIIYFMKHNFGIKKLVERNANSGCPAVTKGSHCLRCIHEKKYKKALSENVYNSHAYTKNIV
jgi:hypothetical protein